MLTLQSLQVPSCVFTYILSKGRQFVTMECYATESFLLEYCEGLKLLFLIARSVNIKGTHFEQNFKAPSVNID